MKRRASRIVAVLAFVVAFTLIGLKFWPREKSGPVDMSNTESLLHWRVLDARGRSALSSPDCYRDGDGGSRRLQEIELEGVLSNAEVVLIADFHDRGYIRRAIPTIIMALNRSRDAVDGSDKIGPMYLEAIASSRNIAVDGTGDLRVSSVMHNDIVRRIRQRWPFPVNEYKAVQNLVKRFNIPVKGFGPLWPSITTNSIPDALRSPHNLYSEHVLRSARMPAGSNDSRGKYHEALSQILREDCVNQARPLVLIGAAHLAGHQGLFRAISRREMSALIIQVCQTPTIDSETSTTEPKPNWYRVSEHVLRCVIPASDK